VNLLRYIAFPFSVLYGIITKVRNILFDFNILKSTQFKIPILIVGNLSVGGTGKTPHIEYLINLLQPKYYLGILSRGYKRKTSGFLLANSSSKVQDIGDEPFQFFKKFDNIKVAVDEDRVEGINILLSQKKPPTIILLDDAFQHRKVKGSLNILLTTYNRLYCNDYLLPMGNLRESKKGANRAQIIIVTKCPKEIENSQKEKIVSKLNPLKGQQVFFTTIKYADFIYGENNSIALKELKEYEIILITGIANPKPMVEFLNKQEIRLHHINFTDHHNFKTKDIQKIKTTFSNLESKKKLILTTEKDYVRIFSSLQKNIFYLPIQVEFQDKNAKQQFDKIVLQHVE